MKLFLVSAALLGMALACVAGAQPAERLARPVKHSYTGEDGKFHVEKDATVGNLGVDAYANLGRRMATADLDAVAMSKALKPVLCDRAGAQAVAAVVKDALKEMTTAQRARLKAREPESLTDLAIIIAASLDQVDADAIRADEALGPGAYHDAITGFRIGLEACDFYGQRP
ncbi:hypothetical protein [Asticcacaulis biprosthecium]|uniref:hypothetical protein n=1 Tax=Asticcacaulis biprosthecium TaxID=76891 RepID=UPI0002FA7641|nr:hypothetical protein [Asticcacaulis biprosthecium]